MWYSARQAIPTPNNDLYFSRYWENGLNHRITCRNTSDFFSLILEKNNAFDTLYSTPSTVSHLSHFTPTHMPQIVPWTNTSKTLILIENVGYLTHIHRARKNAG